MQHLPQPSQSASHSARSRAPSGNSQKRSLIAPSARARRPPRPAPGREESSRDRKSTRLNSSHTVISYAVFCLKKKKKKNKIILNTKRTANYNLEITLSPYQPLNVLTF